MPALKWYKLIFKQLSPIHIGNFRWGVVNQTEIFIPGQVIWGALVKHFLEKENLKNSLEVEKIKRHFEVITNFFPSLDGKNILVPKYGNGEFYLGEFSEREFRFLFTFADFRTSIEPIFRKAKDEHLYEFEYVSPKPIVENVKSLLNKKEIKNKNLLKRGENLRWIGIIGLPEESYKLEEGLKIWIGGDVRYGFGELILEKIKKVEEDELKEWNIDKDGTLHNESLKGIKNFISVNLLKEIENGELKLLVKLNFEKNIPQVENQCTGFYAWVGSDVKVDCKKPKLRCGKFD